ncbi:MAG: glycosyltransferase family 2 protein [Ginsengibacter sp.]
MEAFPKISVQIPTFNQELFIKDALRSALEQRYENMEVIIADDNITNETTVTARDFLNDSRVRYFKNENNLGRIDNYHKSLYDYCNGDWAINLDGDDYFTNDNFLKEALDLISRNEKENITVFQANHNLDKIKKIFKDHKVISPDAVLIDGPTYFLNYYKVQRFRHCATIYNRKEALKLNFYSFDCLSTDFNSIAKLFLKGNVIISGKTVAHWRQHSCNESQTLDEKNLQKERLSIEQLSQFARPYFNEHQIKKWEKKMKAYIITLYIELLTKKPMTVRSLKYTVRHFSYDITYFKQLIRLIIRYS